MYAATTFVVLLAALTFSYAAETQKGKVPEAKLQEVFDDADCDDDGKLSLKEAEDLGAFYGEDKATVDKHFNEADKNNDDQLEFAEYKAAMDSGCCSVTPKAGAAELCSSSGS